MSVPLARFRSSRACKELGVARLQLLRRFSSSKGSRSRWSWTKAVGDLIASTGRTLQSQAKLAQSRLAVAVTSNVGVAQADALYPDIAPTLQLGSPSSTSSESSNIEQFGGGAIDDISIANASSKIDSDIIQSALDVANVHVGVLDKIRDVSSIAQQHAEVLEKVTEQVTELPRNTIAGAQMLSDLAFYQKPSYLLQMAIEQMHASTGLQWWSSMILVTVLLRLFILPIFVYQTKRQADIQQVAPIMALFGKLANEQSSVDGKRTIQQYQQLWMMEGKHSMGKMMLPILVIAPTFSASFFALRAMGDRFPEWESGGIGPWIDLSLSDPTYSIPLVSALVMLGSIEYNFRVIPQVPRRFKQKRDGALGMMDDPNFMRKFPRFFSLVTIPVMCQMPTGVVIMFFVNNCIHLSQALVLSRRSVRHALGIPSYPEITESYKNTPETLARDWVDEQKHTGVLDPKQRMLDLRTKAYNKKRGFADEQKHDVPKWAQKITPKASTQYSPPQTDTDKAARANENRARTVDASIESVESATSATASKPKPKSAKLAASKPTVSKSASQRASTKRTRQSRRNRKRKK